MRTKIYNFDFRDGIKDIPSDARIVTDPPVQYVERFYAG